MSKKDTIQLESSYNSLMEKPNRVYEIFCDYFGEDKVDMQGFKTLEEYINDGVEDSITLFTPFILVWFPTITVKNEYHDSIDIQDVYIKVSISVTGAMEGHFGINRATYPFSQFRSDFLHSHAPGINKSYPEEFLKMCLGKGPIADTVANLQAEYDEDLWQLFCCELDDYLQVESIEGGPYRRMSNINAKDSVRTFKIRMEFNYFIIGGLDPYYRSGQVYNDSYYNLLKDFTRYLLKSGGFPVEFVDGTYSIGMSYIDCTIYISNKFIEWFNREDNPYRKIFSLQSLLDANILGYHSIINGKLFLIGEQISYHGVALPYEGDEICRFKGKRIFRHIMEEQEQNELSHPLFLMADIIKSIVGTIIKVINYKYGRAENTHSEPGGKTLYL